MSTPDPIRAAAYLATRERLDAKKRTTKVKCVAPNRQCGSRCIPPEWDCRLKGEGADPHLKAVGKGSDPVAGLANVERGLTRLRKGVFKLSFSEVEGGRKAIARGAAKLSPGDIKKKEEVKKNVDAFLGRVLLPAAAIVGAGLLHKGLKNFKGYRDGPGRQVDDAASAAIDLVRTNIPGYGARVRERRAAGVAAVGSLGRGIQNLETLGPDSLAVNAGSRRSLTNLVRTQTSQYGFTKGSVAAQFNNYGMDSGLVTRLNRSLHSIDGPSRKPSQMAYIEWHAKSLESFWNTRRTTAFSPGGVDPDGSIFSLHATNTLLSKSFGIEAPRGMDLKGEASAVVGRLSTYFKTTGDSIRTAMRESGLDPKDPDAVVTFIGRSGGATAADSLARQTLTNAVLRTDYETQARQLYSRTVAGYDKLFKRVSEDLRQAPSIDVVRNRGSAQDLAVFRRLRQNSFYNDAVEAHSFFLGRALNLPSPVYGSYTATVARKAYHVRFVAPKKALTTNKGISFALTETEALNAGIEIARAQGLPEPKSAQAGLLLVNKAYGWPDGEYQRGNALSRLTLVRGSASRQFGRSQERPRRPLSFAQRVAALLRQRNSEGKPIYASREAAEAAVRRAEERNREEPTMDARVDAYLRVRNDFTPTRDRKGKPCGKSFVPKQAKCSKPTTARYATEVQAQTGNQGGGLDTAVKVASVAGSVAAVVGAVKNRKRIGRAVKTQKRAARVALKTRNPELYKRYAQARVARRATSSAVRTQTADTIAQLSKKTIQTLSKQDVDQAITKLPERFQKSARNLIGNAKLATAHLALKAKGAKLTSVNNQDNYSNWTMRDGTLLSTGSVGETLLIYNTKPQQSIGGAKTYSTQFRIDGEFDAKSAGATRNSREIVTTVKKMFNSHIEQLPDNSIITATPYAADAKGKKRRSIYERYGFRSALSSDERLFAMKTKGKFTKMKDSHIEQLADLIRNDSRTDSLFSFERLDATLPQDRKGKPCGKSFVPKQAKCTKPTTASYAQKIAVGAAVTGTVAGVAALALIGARRNQVNTYRKQVPKSALEAEKLAIEFERQMREQAATRLKKKPQDVTGFEASVYNYNDKGFERGFSPFETDPKWYGQTKQSKGAVVVLSYADEYGKGGYNMVDGGAFKQIWGDRDPLPFHNAISQPVRGGGADNLQQAARREFLDRTEKIAGKKARTVAEGVIGAREAFGRFKFLRDNVNERGFNPDAVRAAAFVVAQRRLTGKSVDILSYSNGGNVASEALTILAEMGYKDVKVLNVAGPTFGLFSHKPENMRTFVSKGDEFYKIFGESAFQGSNTTYIKNNNIPHGLMDALDPNNPNAGDTAANRRAKRSYVLDEEVRLEGYKFLTVDKTRARQLEEEILYRISKKEKFDGDLRVLFGAKSDETIARYTKMLSNTATRDQAKQQIRAEVEDRMLDVWYGGYSAPKVSNAQKAIRKELETYINPAAPAPRARRAAPKPRQNLNQRVATLMQNNPGMSRETAVAQIMKERKRSDSYTITFLLTKEAVAA